MMLFTDASNKQLTMGHIPLCALLVLYVCMIRDRVTGVSIIRTHTEQSK